MLRKNLQTDSMGSRYEIGRCSHVIVDVRRHQSVFPGSQPHNEIADELQVCIRCDLRISLSNTAIIRVSMLSIRAKRIERTLQECSEASDLIGVLGNRGSIIEK